MGLNIMQTIIVDDKPGPKKVLKNLLAEYFPKIQIIAEANDVSEGIKVITQHKPQLVFLDVEMPDGTGFNLLEQIDVIDFKVIFTTGYEKYAIKAFKFSAIDYLLKPIDPEDLKIAVEKAEEEIKKGDLQLKVGTLLSNVQETSDTLKKIILKDADTIHLEAASNYTKFYLTEDRQILVSNTLKEYETLLEKAGFFRCHKSYIVNLTAISKFDRKGKGNIILANDTIIPISPRKKEEFLALLELL